MLTQLLNKLKLSIFIMKGGENDMVAVYVALIIHGRRTIEQVPTSLRTSVLAELATLGLDGYGKEIV